MTQTQTSREKVLDLIGRAQDMSDADLRDAVPFAAPGFIRLAIASIESMVPEDSAELDDMLDRLGSFVEQCKTDPVPDASA